MNIPVEIKEDDLIDSLKREMSNEELKNFVLKLDLFVAQADFTEDLVTGLLKSLMGDLMGNEKRDLLNKIAEIFGLGKVAFAELEDY